MNYLGEYFSFATGTEEDMDKAIFWWEKAAEEEHKRALF
jgi:TPR repeat protein